MFFFLFNPEEAKQQLLSKNLLSVNFFFQRVPKVSTNYAIVIPSPEILSDNVLRVKSLARATF